MPTARRPDDATAGYAILETMIAIVIVSLAAALVVPPAQALVASARLERTTSAVVSLLRADRNSALRSGKPVATIADTDGLLIRSDANGIVVPIPDGVTVNMQAQQGVVFYPDGRSSGGVFRLSQAQSLNVISIDAATSAIRLSAPNAGSGR
ncbi:Tfp pilus assembly protein FimT/FimU [Georhizobium sp. MAB10]|uniref:pilus assembly FimT family protein n=1 Tax=Georhizobium sp. MAB10 TaxID=3028319 RepID=UPI0038559AA3